MIRFISTTRCLDHDVRIQGKDVFNMFRFRIVLLSLVVIGACGSTASLIAQQRPKRRHFSIILDDKLGPIIDLNPESDTKRRSIVKTYGVKDFLSPESQVGKTRKEDIEALLKLAKFLAGTVARGNWVIYDGNGERLDALEDDFEAGAIIPFIMSSSLIVRHTPEVHEEFGERLEQLRQVVKARDAVGKPVPPQPLKKSKPVK
jgi:hypothetical protein